ncbi:hypothetical protein [Dishui Lake phycodnavirus 4]|jgi:hypothetical protein|nr:hypothetical protein [Dishui Lake phycodnavirus 4]
MKKTFSLNDVIRPEPTVSKGYVRTSVYRKEDYINGLRKNYIQCGLDPARVDEIDLKIPEEIQRTYTTSTNDLVIDDWETVKVKIDYYEDRVRVTIDTSLWDMFAMYYTKGINPPIELKVKAFRSMDFSEERIEHMIKKDQSNRKFCAKVGKIIDKIFDKEPVKKPPKTKKIEPVLTTVDEEAEVALVDDDDMENEEDDEGTEEDALIDEDADNDDDYVENEDAIEVEDDVE